MEYVRGIDSYNGRKRTAVTIGKFDGLHLGHDLLVTRIEELQKEQDIDGVVFAFDMGPLYEKLEKKPDFLLTSDEKAKRLEGRVNYFIDCPFTENISSMEAEKFIEDILVKKLHAKYVVVGVDFYFGYQKRGNYRMLQKYSEKFDYIVEVFDKMCYEGREISSTYIKEELEKGNEELVNKLLGYNREEIKGVNQ